MKHNLKAWLVDNPITVDNKDDKILLLEPAGTLTLDDILELMLQQDTGLRRETLRHSVDLYNRTITDSVLSGYGVNTGLYRVVPQFRGVVEGGKWNPKKNSIYVSFTQDKDLREAIAQTTVTILGEKSNVMYIAGSEDAATRATDGSATAGRNYILNGRMLKIVGTDPAVGVTLTDVDGKVTRLADDMIAVNNPSQVIVLLPANLTDGDYTITVTTQYSGGGSILKTPRSVSKIITIGQSSGGGEDDGGGEAPDPLA